MGSLTLTLSPLVKGIKAAASRRLLYCRFVYLWSSESLTPPAAEPIPTCWASALENVVAEGQDNWSAHSLYRGYDWPARSTLRRESRTTDATRGSGSPDRAFRPIGGGG